METGTPLGASLLADSAGPGLKGSGRTHAYPLHSDLPGPLLSSPSREPAGREAGCSARGSALKPDAGWGEMRHKPEGRGRTQTEAWP